MAATKDIILDPPPCPRLSERRALWGTACLIDVLNGNLSAHGLVATSKPSRLSSIMVNLPSHDSLDLLKTLDGDCACGPEVEGSDGQYHSLRFLAAIISAPRFDKDVIFHSTAETGDKRSNLT